MHETMEEVMPELDILYMTRVQEGRFGETEAYQARPPSSCWNWPPPGRAKTTA